MRLYNNKAKAVIIVRYLTREVLTALLAITFILLVAFLSQQMVRYLNYVAVGKIPTGIFLELISFEVPYLLALLLPLGLYLGILLAYGRLYADNEMAILQMSGFGNTRLMRLTAFIAVVVGSVVLALMLWVNPWVSSKRQQLIESDEAMLHMIQTLIPGRFQASPDGRYVMYVEKLSRDHERAENVFLAQQIKTNDDIENSAWTLVFASQGYERKDKRSQTQFFVATDGYRYEGTPGQNDYKIVRFKKYEVRLPQADARAAHLHNETLSTDELWQSYANPNRAAELQWRFSIAISTFLLALLAVPLSTIRPRQSRYIVLLPAVLIYIVYFNLLFVARRWVEQEIVSISVGMWWVHSAMLVVILFALLLNARKWK